MMSLVSPALQLIQPLCPHQQEHFGHDSHIGKKLQHHQHSLHTLLFSPELGSAELACEKHALLNISGHQGSPPWWPHSRHITSLTAQRQHIHPQHHLRGMLHGAGRMRDHPNQFTLVAEKQKTNSKHRVHLQSAGQEA